MWCATTDEGARLDAGALRNALAMLPPEIALVALVAVGADAEAAVALAIHGVPVATGHAATDAVKRLVAGRIVATLDRSRLYTVRLPAIVDRMAVETQLGRDHEPTCLVADLVTAGAVCPTLVDRNGAVIAPVT